MNCEKARNLIDAYVDGELEAPERALIEAHLDTCADCMKVRRQVEQMTELSRAFSASPPLGLQERIQQEIARPRATPMSRMKEILMTKNGMRFGIATIAVAVALGATVMLAPHTAEASSGAAILKKMIKATQGMKAMHSVSVWNQPDGSKAKIEIWTDGRDLYINRMGHLEIMYKGKFYEGGKPFDYGQGADQDTVIATGPVDPAMFTASVQIREISRGQTEPEDLGFGTLRGTRVRVVSIVNQEGTEKHVFYVDPNTGLPLKDEVWSRAGNKWVAFGWVDYEFIDSLDPKLFKNLPREIKTHESGGKVIGALGGGKG